MTEADFQELSTEDLNKYYSNCFLNFSFNKEVPKFHYIERFEDEGYLRFGENKKQSHFTEIKINFSIPESGYYNYQDSSVFFSKKLIKQWKKGICPDSFWFRSFEIFSSELLKIGVRKGKGTFPWTEEAVNSVLSSPLSCPIGSIDSVLKELKVSQALSRDFLVSLGVTSIAPQLWFRQRIIGTFTNKRKIKIISPFFKEEAKDFFSPHQIEII